MVGRETERSLRIPNIGQDDVITRPGFGQTDHFRGAWRKICRRRSTCLILQLAVWTRFWQLCHRRLTMPREQGQSCCGGKETHPFQSFHKIVKLTPYNTIHHIRPLTMRLYSGAHPGMHSSSEQDLRQVELHWDLM